MFVDINGDNERHHLTVKLWLVVSADTQPSDWSNTNERATLPGLNDVKQKVCIIGWYQVYHKYHGLYDGTHAFKDSMWAVLFFKFDSLNLGFEIFLLHLLLIIFVIYNSISCDVCCSNFDVILYLLLLTLANDICFCYAFITAEHCFNYIIITAWFIDDMTLISDVHGTVMRVFGISCRLVTVLWRVWIRVQSDCINVWPT